MVNIKVKNLKTVKWIGKDKKYRKYFYNYEINKLILKSLLYNNINYPFLFKIYFDFKFKKFTFKSSISKARTSCMFLGNSRSVFRRFKMSRHLCKKYASFGFLVGLKKSSF